MFWVQVAIALAALGGLYYYVEFVERRLQRTADDRVRVVDAYLDEVKARMGEFQEERRAAFADSDAAIQRKVGELVDQAFEPVYANIPAYLDYHYSILGGYTELAAGLAEKLGLQIADALREKLFDEQAFEQRLNGIGKTAGEEIGKAVGRVRAAAVDKLGFSGGDLRLADRVALLSWTTIEARFSPQLNVGRLLGAGAGGLVGAQLAKALTSRFVAALGKAAAKRAAGGTGAGVGATEGGKAGFLVCGPLCAGVGAMIGGVVGWIVTEQLIAKLDEAINRSSFETEVRKMLDAQKTYVKQKLAEGLGELNKRISVCIEESFEAFVKDGVKVIDVMRDRAGVAACNAEGS